MLLRRSGKPPQRGASALGRPSEECGFFGFRGLGFRRTANCGLRTACELRAAAGCVVLWLRGRCVLSVHRSGMLRDEPGGRTSGSRPGRPACPAEAERRSMRVAAAAEGIAEATGQARFPAETTDPRDGCVAGVVVLAAVGSTCAVRGRLRPAGVSGSCSCSGPRGRRSGRGRSRPLRSRSRGRRSRTSSGLADPRASRRAPTPPRPRNAASCPPSGG